MKNVFLNNVLKIRITGKGNILFLKRIIKKKIELLEIIKIDNNTLEVKINEKDYEKIKEIKTICNIEIIDVYGIKKIKKLFLINQYIIFFVILGLISIIFLSNVIFKVEVIHNNPAIRNLLTKELEKYDIKKYKLIKNYDEINKIKKKILDNYKNKIEWLEIERTGTKYTVRVEERIINNKKNNSGKYNIISNSNATILSIKTISGQRMKNVNEYVKKGDIIISGEIKLNDEVKDIVSADGIVYGEVWYNVTSTYPFLASQSDETGKKTTAISLNIFGRRIELFSKRKYKNYKLEGTKLLGSNLFPISIIKEKKKEVKITSFIYTDDQAEKYAVEQATKKIESNLKPKEKIITAKKLKVTQNNSTISVDMFFTVYKNIGEKVEANNIMEE